MMNVADFQIVTRRCAPVFGTLSLLFCEVKQFGVNQPQRRPRVFLLGIFQVWDGFCGQFNNFALFHGGRGCDERFHPLPLFLDSSQSIVPLRKGAQTGSEFSLNRQVHTRSDKGEDCS